MKVYWIQVIKKVNKVSLQDYKDCIFATRKRTVSQLKKKDFIFFFIEGLCKPKSSVYLQPLSKMEAFKSSLNY